MKRRKINLYNYALKPKDDIFERIGLYGIFHDRGKKIATDGHLLCAVRSEYPKEYGGKIVSKQGEIIKAKYPKWRGVIPKTTPANLLELDAGSLRARTSEGLDKAKKDKLQVIVAVKGLDGDTFFEGKELLKFLDFLDTYPNSKVYYTSFSRPLKAESKNGDLCLIMPRSGNVEWHQLLVDYPRVQKNEIA